MSANLPAHIDLTKLREIFLALAKRRVRDEQDAEEIVQDALMTVVEKSASQTFEKSFLQWAFGVLRNKIGNYYQQRDRRQRTTHEITEDTERTLRSAMPDPLAASAESELRGKIQKSWLRLGMQCRRLLWMLYSGYSREEIFAEFPQYHFKVVNTKIFRCRNYLRRLLRQEGYSL
jgi:RNA polymerase sigma factor (sigma-70 family)